MTIYCFSCNECGNRMEKTGSMKNPPKRVKCECGNWCYQDFKAKFGKQHCGDTWSQTGGFSNDRGETGSLSRAVHTDQAREQIDLDKKKGVKGVDWKPDGRGLVRPHFSSKKARDNWDRAYGFESESHS